MLKNYFKIALRNLKTSKGYTMLNLFGLAIGLTGCLVLFQYVSYEKSYDAFNKQADNIVRLRMDFHAQGRLTMQSATVFPGLGPRMKKDFPEISNYCRLVDAHVAWAGVEPAQLNLVFSNDAQNIRVMENKGFYVDPSFLQMFTIPFLKGDPNTALNGPDKMVISEDMAKKYFGTTDATGKLMTIREGGQVYNYLITGVFKNYPKNSHLSFDYLISYKTFIGLIHRLSKGNEMDPDMTLNWYDFYVYLQLRPGADGKALEAKFPAFSIRYNINSPRRVANNNLIDFYTMPMRDIHLYSHYNEEASVNGDGKSVSFLFLVAFIIIAIAWVNYTNLATARSLERAREVGVRKLLGALRADLIVQFLTESFLLNLTALVIAVVLALLFTPFFNGLLSSNMDFGIHLPAAYVFGFVGLFLAGSFLSGIYPAFILSGYQPISVLKGAFKNTNKGHFLRKGLIMGQFAVSIILIVGTVIVFQQVSFMRNQQLGVNIDRTLVLNGPVSVLDSAYVDSYRSFKDELLQVSGVKNVTASTSVMGKEIYYTNDVGLVHSPDHQVYTFYFQYMDEDFVPAFDIKMLAGRNFSKEFTTDKKAMLLNETAAKLLGFKKPADALNEKIGYYRDSIKIIGVVADFHQMGLNQSINPIIFMLKPEAKNFYSIKLNTPNTSQTITSVEKVWARHFPADPFNFFFLNQSFDNQYKADIQFGKVFGIFSVLAICIACFGLLSLSAYTVIQRTKEIGIRKVLGASVGGIFILLSREMIILVLASILIATPIAWYVMYLWLRDFAYRVTIHWWVFVLAGLATVLIAVLTVSYQAVKAAMTNPTKSLRAE
ncbi:MAG TPA: ABC transporter permease [Mucilaginibacter sp.]|jgi:putative ABC transport system permease protein